MNSKPLLISLLLVSPVIASCANAETQPDTSWIKITKQICESGEMQSSKYIRSADAFILSCDCDCTAQENRIWIIFDRSQEIYRLDASKAVSTLELKGIDAIPDTFGKIPLCENARATESTITILTKMPSTNDASPYCYSAKYFVKQSNTQCKTTECMMVLDSL